MIRRVYMITPFFLWMMVPVSALPACQTAEIKTIFSQISSLMEKERFSEAIESLKKARAIYSGQRPFVLLLAKAYLLDNNPVWALKTLYAWSDEHPSDGETASWIVWIHLQNGQLDKAEAQSRVFNSSDFAPLVTRDHLFSSYLELISRHPSQARDHFKKAVRSFSGFPEDCLLAEQMGNALFPQWKGRYGLTYDFNTGYSTHPSLASTFGENVKIWGSAFGGSVSAFRLDPLLTHPLRPVFTFQQSFLYYADSKGPEPPSNSSYFFPEFRLDLIWSLGSFKPVTSYAAGAYLLNSPYTYAPAKTLWLETFLPEQSHWFHEYHRFELDVPVGQNLALLGAFGKRWFNPMGRTRFENEFSAAYQLPPFLEMEAAAAISGRYYPAASRQYDIAGGTILLSIKRRFFPKWEVSLGTAGSWDDYPRSSGFFDERHERLDRLYLFHSGIHYECLETMMFYGEYEFAARQSNVSTAIADYDYQDHRFRLGIRGSFRTGICPSPEKSNMPGDRVMLPYTNVSNPGEALGQVRELLRHREDLRRGSTCLN